MAIESDAGVGCTAANGDGGGAATDYGGGADWAIGCGGASWFLGCYFAAVTVLGYLGESCFLNGCGPGCPTTPRLVVVEGSENGSCCPTARQGVGGSANGFGDPATRWAWDLAVARVHS